MSMESPRQGKCNAQLGDKFCGNHVMLGATRCLTHGGGAEATAGLRESLYTKRLRQAFKSPEDQKLFEEMPKATDLTEEIRVARMRIVKYQELLEQGVDVLFVKDGKSKPLAAQIAQDGEADVSVKQVAISVHDLLRDALQSLRALVVSQESIHPGSDKGGNLRLTITLAGAAKPRVPVPDLTDDSTSTRLLPAHLDSARDVEGVRPTRSGTGYEDDD